MQRKSSKYSVSGKAFDQWADVEKYLVSKGKQSVTVKKYGDILNISASFTVEYCESRYTKSLRGALVKAKANAAQVIDEMIENSE